ncbi:MAG TPA: type I methionyl aminopeptidase [Candidatus Limnocylindria bacterium]|nr:type I methionyl aminopeptidase [Candidatus Limnocylindria bacterium]
MITLKTAAQMAQMREAGRVVAAMLDACRAAVRPGITTAELDRIAAEVLRKANATSSFFGYYGHPIKREVPPGFPRTICTSINEEIVHGIPSPKRKLREGDIVGIDAGAIIDGWHADAAITLPVGRVSPEADRLIRVTEEALRIGIANARVGGRIGDIGTAIEEFVRAQGYTVVQNYVGHGIGRAMHEEPQVPNYKPARGHPNPPISEGLCIAIEPMVNIGGAGTRTLEDQWTVVTVDRSLSAHFEHTLACTAAGPVVLTSPGEGAAVAA